MDMQSFYFFAHLAGKLAFAVSEILHIKMNKKKIPGLQESFRYCRQWDLNPHDVAINRF